MARSRSLACVLLAATLVLAPAGAAWAQADSDFHFRTDTTNRAQVDDRGGSNSYTFEMRVDDADTNSEDYCPHCRFSLLTVDLGITMTDLERLGIIDRIIEEPTGGAHRDAAAAIEATGDAVADALTEFDGMTPEQIRRQRHEKFMAIGRSL